MTEKDRGKVFCEIELQEAHAVLPVSAAAGFRAARHHAIIALQAISYNRGGTEDVDDSERAGK